MKALKSLFISLTLVSLLASCNAQTTENKSQAEISKGNIEVYYFHYTRRCATCNAVENVSKDAIKEFYGDDVAFASYNLEEQEGESKGKEIGVSGQTLIIVSGDKKVNLTNEGFMYALSDPGKLKEKIKAEIDKLM